jgi:hypothetical protein
MASGGPASVPARAVAVVAVVARSGPVPVLVHGYLSVCRLDLGGNGLIQGWGKRMSGCRCEMRGFRKEVGILYFASRARSWNSTFEVKVKLDTTATANPAKLACRAEGCCSVPGFNRDYVSNIPNTLEALEKGPSQRVNLEETTPSSIYSSCLLSGMR